MHYTHICDSVTLTSQMDVCGIVFWCDTPTRKKNLTYHVIYYKRRSFEISYQLACKHTVSAGRKLLFAQESNICYMFSSVTIPMINILLGNTQKNTSRHVAVHSVFSFEYQQVLL